MKVAKVDMGQVVETRDVPDDWFARAVAAGNPKVAGLLPVVEDDKPVLGQHEFVEPSYTVEDKQVRVTWTKRTDADSVALATKRTEIDDALAQLTTLQDSSGDLTVRQLSNAARLIARVLVWLIQRGKEIFER